MFQMRHYKAPENSGVNYERYFYFFKVPYADIISSPCDFKYQIRHNITESPVYDFQSKMFCSKYYRVLAFGQHDNSKIGNLLISSANWQSFDVLVLTGNYVTGYHLDDGRLGDEYFDRMQTLTTKMITLVIPGRRESFDNYRMFQSRFMMPGCKAEVDCDVAYFLDKKINIMLINLDKVLQKKESSMDTEKQLMTQIMDANKRFEEATQTGWKVVFSNADFYCSQHDKHSNCIADQYKLKMFEDLFDLINVNLMVSSGRKIYESIRDVFNYAIRPDGQPRNYVVSGLAGCTNYLTTNDLQLMPDLSFTGTVHHQAVFTMDIFNDYYKMDLLNVPTFTSLDLRFVRYSFDWDKLILYMFFFVGMIGLFALFHFNQPRGIGTNLATGRSPLASIVQPRPKSELQENLLKDVAALEFEVEGGMSEREVEEEMMDSASQSKPKNEGS